MTYQPEHLIHFRFVINDVVGIHVHHEKGLLPGFLALIRVDQFDDASDGH